MKAIETMHNGVLYRSRLEARWAIIFNLLNINYAYEPRQFLTKSGLYLPDFYLPMLAIWIEIKPGTVGGALPVEIEKAQHVADTTIQPCLILCGLPSIENCAQSLHLCIPGRKSVKLHARFPDELQPYVVGAVLSAVNREKSQRTSYIGDILFKDFIKSGMIDRYAHNKTAQENNTHPGVNLYSQMDKLRDFIKELAFALVEYSSGRG